MKIQPSFRIRELPPYLFFELDLQKKKALEEGRNIIDLGVGDPDIECPSSLIEVIYRESKIKVNQKYPFDSGSGELKYSIKAWMKRRFGVNIEDENEILPLIGSKEGIVHFPMAILEEGDCVLVPNPCYPPYRSAVIFCGARIIDMPLQEENNFLPDLERIPKDILKRTKLMFLNYPNNPTSFCASEEFLRKVVEFAHQFGFIIIYDNAYSELYCNKVPLSILQIDGAKDVCIEFHSFSKTFCMTGFRLGWAVGNVEFITLLLRIKSNIDSGVFLAIQKGGSYLLNKEEGFIQRMRELYKKRREFFIEGLKSLGFEVRDGGATFYVWTKVQEKSIDFSKRLLIDFDIVATPGLGFGEYGEGYIRFSVTQPQEVLEQALERLRKV